MKDDNDGAMVLHYRPPADDTDQRMYRDVVGQVVGPDMFGALYVIDRAERVIDEKVWAFGSEEPLRRDGVKLLAIVNPLTEKRRAEITEEAKEAFTLNQMAASGWYATHQQPLYGREGDEAIRGAEHLVLRPHMWDSMAALASRPYREKYAAVLERGARKRHAEDLESARRAPRVRR